MKINKMRNIMKRSQDGSRSTWRHMIATLPGQRGAVCGVLIVLSLFAVTHADASPVVFQNGLNGYTGTEDTYLNGGNATSSTNNFGGKNSFTASGSVSSKLVGLIRFQNIFGTGTYQVPSNVYITNAILRLHASKRYSYAEDEYIRAYRMTTDWIAGTGTGGSNGSYVEGASTFMARRQRVSGVYADADKWGTDGAMHNAPVGAQDFDGAAPALSSLNIASKATNTVLYAMDFDVTSFVRAWQVGVYPNNGVELEPLRSGYSYVIYHSSEATVSAYRPELIIEYAQIPEVGVVTFQNGLDGYAGTEDTALLGGVNSNYNYGGYSYVECDGINPNGKNNAGLLRFLNIFGEGQYQVPPSSIITNAILRLHSNYRFNFDNPARVYVRQMLTNWEEGTGTPKALLEGMSCYAARRYRASGVYANEDKWGTDGAMNVAPVKGQDYSSTVVTSNELGSVYNVVDENEYETDLDITSLVKDWQRGATANFGMLISLESYWSVFRFHSAQYWTQAHRPELKIAYFIPPVGTLLLIR